MPELKLLLLQMAVILAAARLLSWAFRLIDQPAVIGEMAAGILLGPSLLGRFWPEAMDALFPAGGLGGIYALSQIGLVLFMFLVGLELRPDSLRAVAKPLVIASQASIAAPFLFGSLLAWILYPELGNGVPKLPFVLFIGIAIGITAFPVLARILADRGLTQTRIGVVALSCAAFDDLTAWSLLAVVTAIARSGSFDASLVWRLAALVAYIFTMLFVIRPLIRGALSRGRPLGVGGFASVMLLLLISALTTEALGVHALLGAFITGLVMPKGAKEEQVFKERLDSVTVVLFLPLFFAYNGLRTSIGLLNHPRLWLLCGVIVFVAVGSKLIVSALAVHASGMSWRESVAVGVLVNTKGLVELVILNVGLDLHILSPTMFSIMVIMALATTVMTSPLLDRIVDRSSLQ